MIRINIIPTLIAAIVLLTTIGCSPRLTPSDDTPPSEWLFGADYPADSLILPIDWWSSFGDTTLNNLVERALVQNRDLTAAASKLIASQQKIRYVRSEYLPSLSISAEAEVEHTYATKSVDTYTIEPTVSWELPLFGQLRHTSAKACAESIAAESNLNAMRLSIAAEVATSYFTLLQAKTSLSISERSCNLRRESAALIDSLYKFGMSDAIALEQARSLLFSAESAVAQYRRAVAQTEMSMSTLIGENPSAITTDGFDQRIPLPISIGIPSELLDRRPDIVESYNVMAAAAANVGIARSARYPSISLTAEGGVASSTLKGLTSGSPGVWSAAAALTAPIFKFGRLRSGEQIARAEYDEAVATYEATMLTAYSEVEQSLVAIESYSVQRRWMQSLVGANERIATTTSALYKSGMNDYLNVIDAEREYYASQIDLIATVAQQYISYISLYKALGGGY